MTGHRSLWLCTALFFVGCAALEEPGFHTSTDDDDDELADDDAGDDDGQDSAHTCEPQPGFAYTDAILIDAGVFVLGSDEQSPWPEQGAFSFGGLDHAYGDETPAHEVELGAFCIEKYEVTLERFEACVDLGVCDPWRGDRDEDFDLDTPISYYPEECYHDITQCLDWPVNERNLAQARVFCDWSGGRLCTEAEWERVASGPGPDKPTFPWGDDPPTDELANVYEYSESGIGPLLDRVASHPAGASHEGVFNLTGNVFEWVSDWYAPYEVGQDGLPVVDPTGPPSGEHRITRGGCGLAVMGHEVTMRMTARPGFDWG